MGIRVRRDGSMWCAAHTELRDGDTYIDDELHYYLSVERKIIVALPMPDHAQNPQWWWIGAAPPEAQGANEDDMEKIIIDCQKILAEHLPPDGVDAKTTISRLLDILDGPRARTLGLLSPDQASPRV